MDSVLQAGVVSAPLQVIIDRLATLTVHETSLILGADDEVRKLQTTLERIKAMVAHAEEDRSIFSASAGAWKAWLDDVEALSYSADDMLDDISLDLLRHRATSLSADHNQVRNMLLSSFRLTVPREISRIRQEMDLVAKEMESFYMIELTKSSGSRSRMIPKPDYGSCCRATSSFGHGGPVVGRDTEINQIVEMLLLENDDDDVSVIPVVGMGGIGKTTLAQIVYNDDRIQGKFDMKMWASVSMDFDAVTITRSIIESGLGKRCKLSGLDPVQVKLSDLVRGKRFILVLDDYWSEKYGDWDVLSSPFRAGSKGSKILVTTRSMKVGRVVGSVPSYRLECLTDDNCWELMKGRRSWCSSIEGIGRMIARKCKGLPLAAKTIGSMLQFKDDPGEWDSVLNSEMWDIVMPQEGENDVFPALALSYYHLPNHLKKCFTYCSIFPKSYDFEMNELVLLWMAEGFIRPRGKLTRFEDIGSDYFKDLVWRSFFQLSHLNVHGENIYRMHDAIHSMAQLLAGHACLRHEDMYALSRNTRHFSLRCGGSRSVQVQPMVLEGSLWYKNLRTFRVVYENVGCLQVSYDLFLKSKSLRVLDLSCTGLDELPDSIGHLKHLRYLNLSGNHFRKLPESVTNLFNLQTLKLEQCFRLVELSSNMKNMTGLRHLHLNLKQLNCMPSEFGKLTDLQNLSMFIVGRNRGCGIGELKNMRFLRGSLCIKNLENVPNVSEAKEAMLCMKPFLGKIELEWNEPSSNDGEILAGLLPHENLREMSITNYNGFLMPSWFSGPFCKLSSLCLRSCQNYQILIPLGKLEHLKSLVIEDMPNWPNVYKQFSWFPYLESLTIKDVPNLESWEYPCRGNLFPCLRNFVIDDCPKLTNLPSLVDAVVLQNLSIIRCPEIRSLPHDGLPSSLQALTISECDMIKDRCRVEEGADWWKIKSVPRIEIDFVEIPPEMRRF